MNIKSGKLPLLFFYLFFTIPLSLHAQPGWNLKENNLWPIIKIDSALDFNTGSPPSTIHKHFNPTMFGSCMDITVVSYASVCDVQGNLLFYIAGGDTVFNRNGSPMPNGYDIDQALYNTQGLLILPVLNNPNRYYLFVQNVSDMYGPVITRLSYSVIDMTMDNGMGDIVAGMKNIPLLPDSVAGMMAAVPGNNCDLWVMTHHVADTIFKAFHIAQSGVDTNPVISTIGSLYNPPLGTLFQKKSFVYGNLAFSPDRTKLAMTSHGMKNNNNLLQLFDFDANTGMLSHALIVDTNTYTVPGSVSPFHTNYGVCFSPDNSKLYISRLENPNDFGSFMHLVQYDLSIYSLSPIIQSKTILPLDLNFPNSNFYKRGIRLGPDGKIYFGGNRLCLGVIHEPNQAGLACNIDSSFIKIIPDPNDMTGGRGPDFYIPLGLGADYVKPIPDTLYVHHDIALCYQDSVVLKSSSSFFYYYEWNDGSIDSQKVIKEQGTYWVKSGNYCLYRIDTFVVLAVNADASLGTDTVICNQSSDTLTALVDSAQYLWQDGSTGQDYLANGTGTYWVQVSKKGCTQTDTIHLTLKNLQQDLGPDLVFCKDDPINVDLLTTTITGNSFLWSTGDIGNSITATDSGTYWVHVSNPPCAFSDSIDIDIDPYCDCSITVPTAFSPNNDGLNDVFLPVIDPGCPIRNYSLSIYNRYGQRIYSTTKIYKGWDGKQDGHIADVGTYFYELRFEAGTKNKSSYKKGDITLLR